LDNMNIGFADVLTIVFIILKLTEYIDWSWFWVLSPILIEFIIIFILKIIEEFTMKNKL